TGRASTVLEWYDDPEEDTALPVYQYLQLNVRDLAPGYHFKMYGRLGDDLNDEDDDAKSELYYAYIEKKDLVNGLDFRLGRQFISTTAGASLMDGLALDYSFLENYKLKLFGGGDVTYYEGYNVKDVIAGVELGGSFFDENLEVAASYLQKWDGGLLAQELVGFDASLDLNGKLWLYNESQWDILSERLSYELVGAKYRFEEPLTLRAEYLYSLPVFSSTSIYSVFAVEEYEELMAEATWMVQPGVQTFLRATRELYDEFDDANVFEIGVEKLRTGKCSGYLTGTVRRDDDGQNLHGFKVYGAYRFLSQLQAGIGVNIDVLEREVEYFETDGDADETTSKRFWADVLWNVTDKINVEGKVERVESDLWDYYNRGRIRLNILF
ncbi:MAG: hypothetical protein NDI73_12555, partial [Desulfuromonadales bacterium]|nr:hypothetical protein [Desulfuromonadales bacterium]